MWHHIRPGLKKKSLCKWSQKCNFQSGATGYGSPDYDLCPWHLVPLQCRCHPGFQLKRDGKTCVDVDECTTTYPCSQRCINTHGSFHCLCVDGFEFSPNDRTICKSTSGEVAHPRYGHQGGATRFHQLFDCLVSLTDEEPFLIFANRYYLRKLNLDGSNYTLIKQVGCAEQACRLPWLLGGAPVSCNHVFVFQGLNNAVALDFHYAEQMIYWTDVTTQGSMIRRMRMNGSSMEVTLHCCSQLCWGGIGTT